MFPIPETWKVVEALEPATDAGGRTGVYISLKNVKRAILVFHITQGAANTVACSLSEATAVAPTGAQAVTQTLPIWSNLDCAASDALVRRTDAANYTTDAGVKHKIIVFDIQPNAVLTINSAYDCIAAVTGASNAGNLTSAQWYLEQKYAEDASPTVLTN